MHKIIRFYGLRRSGNHAVIKWILSQTSTDYEYYNNVWPNQLNMSKPDEIRDLGTEDKLTIFSFEDRDLRIASSNQWLRKFTNHIPSNSLKLIDCLILRDPFNVFSSRLKRGMTNPLFFCGLSVPQLYIQYSKEWENPGTYLPDNRVLISYNKWKSSSLYRTSLRRDIGLESRPENLDLIPQYGGGSSFEPGLANGGLNLATDDRWIAYQSNPTFLQWISRPRMINFAASEFPLSQELISFAESQYLKSTPQYNEVVDFLCLNLLSPLWLKFRTSDKVFEIFFRLYRVLRDLG